MYKSIFKIFLFIFVIKRIPLMLHQKDQNKYVIVFTYINIIYFLILISCISR